MDSYAAYVELSGYSSNAGAVPPYQLANGLLSGREPCASSFEIDSKFCPRDRFL